MKRLLPILFLVGCTPATDDLPPPRENVTYQVVRPVFVNHCAQCHSSGNLNWLEYDRAFQYRAQIYQRAVLWKTMPPGKILPAEDRGLIRDWFKQGSKK